MPNDVGRKASGSVRRNFPTVALTMVGSPEHIIFTNQVERVIAHNGWRSFSAVSARGGRPVSPWDDPSLHSVTRLCQTIRGSEVHRNVPRVPRIGATAFQINLRLILSALSLRPGANPWCVTNQNRTEQALYCMSVTAVQVSVGVEDQL